MPYRKRKNSRPKKRRPDRVSPVYIPKGAKRRAAFYLKKIKDGMYTDDVLEKHLKLLESVFDQNPKKINWEQVNHSLKFCDIYLLLWGECGKALNAYFSKLKSINAMDAESEKNKAELNRKLNRHPAIKVILSEIRRIKDNS